MASPPLSLAAIRQPAFLYDADGRLAEANDLVDALAGRPLAGRTLAALVGIFDIHSPDGTPLTAADLPAARALDGVEAVDVPLVIRAADGRTLHVLATAAPVLNGGEVAGALECWQDMTSRERLRAEAETAAEELRQQGDELVRAVVDLDRQRRLLDGVLGTMPHHVSLWDRDQRLVWANECFAAALGEPRETLIGRTWRELWREAAEIAPLVEGALRAVGAGTPFTREVEAAGPEGLGWRTVTFLPIFGDQVLVITEDVTERKWAEEALRETRDFLDNLINCANAPIIVWGPDLSITRINAAFEHLSGYAADEMIGRDLAILFPEKNREESLEKIRHTLTERWQSVEIPILRPDGGIRIALWNSANIYEREGTALLATIAEGQDITERKKAEEALRESEALQGFLVTLNDALAPLADPAAVQKAAARVLGEHLGADWVAYFEVDGDDFVIEHSYAPTAPSAAGRHPIAAFGPRLLAEYRAGRTLVMTDTATDPDLSPAERTAFAAVGARAFIGVPLVKAGAFVAGLGVNARAPRAWTPAEVALAGKTAERTWAAVGRARAEKALRESEAKYRSLFDSLDAGFCIIEMLFDEAGMPVDYVFLEANPAFVKQTGLADAIGRRMRELNPAHEEHWFRIYGEIAKTGEPRGFVESAVLIDGWYEVYAFPIGEPGANRVAVLFTDITERMRTEAALQEYAMNLQRSNEDLKRFAHVSSHDLQEPLRSIVSFSQLLERRYKGQLGEDADEYIDFIVEGGIRMQALIQDLLAYSRVNTTRQDLRPTDTEDVLGAVERSLDVQLREAMARITHDPMPVVLADPLQLEQVFSNLVSNAIKFRRPDRPSEIRISAERVNGFWQFAVADNGIGIEPEYLDQIFVIFQRLHTKDRYPGTGIGLAIVKRIIDRHGGTVRVESTPGQGSTFFFTLPAA